MSIAVRNSGSGQVEITVRDNGRTSNGNVSPRLAQSGRGLANMQSRSSELGGNCSIAHDTAGGVCVTLNLPVFTAREGGDAEFDKSLVDG